MDVIGTSNDDFLVGTTGDDVIQAGAGNDTVAATQGHDSVDGGADFDYFNIRMGNTGRFAAATGARVYTVTSGHVGDSSGTLNSDFVNIERVWLDTVGTGNFNDTIDASGFVSSSTDFGALRVTAGNGNNSITGSAMSDIISAGTGNNSIDAGAGYDQASVSFNNTTGSTLMVTGSGGTVLTSADGVSSTITNAELVGVIGATFAAATTTMDASALTGFSGQVVFYDNNGSNIDIGSAGSDIFANVTGAVLGHDVYTGNGGADVFDYTYAVDAMTGDTITDFDSNDTIDLRFNNLEVGGSPLLANQFIGTAAFTETAGQYRYYVSGGQTFVEVDTDGDGVGDHSLNIANGTYQLVETEAGSNILKMGAPATSGTDGGEVLTGTSGDDVIYGLAGNDAIHGQDGNDYLVGGAGDDTIDGGNGDDIAAFVLPEGLAGTLDIVPGTGANEGLYVVQRTDGATVEDLFLITLQGPGLATVQGINSAASLGTDTLTNIAELQFALDGGSDPARFVSGQIDVMQPGGAGHGVEGTIFDDVINLANYPGAPSVFGADGNDTITGTAGNEYFEAGAGNDTVYAGAGNDIVQGGDGDDVLTGQQGDDSINGGSGDDLLVGGIGNNVMDGGDGFDIVSAVIDLSVSNTVEITGSGANITTSQAGIVTNQITNAEIARVYSANVGVTATLDATNYVSAPGGYLWLIDHNGTDIMIGSSGSEGFANTYTNVTGTDVFTGNGGADIFDYTYAAAGMNGDTITDFSSDDQIDLRFNDAANTTYNGGIFADHFIGNAAFTGVAGEYRYFASGGQTFVEADSNGDGVADLTLTLSNGTFELVETTPGSNILKMGRPIISGTSAGEFLVGTTGDDVIQAGAGNDAIAATAGHDSVDGATGYDQFNIRMSFTDRFAAATGARTYTVTAGHVGDTSGALNSDFSNIERLWIDTVGAGNFNDTIDASGYVSANTGFGALRLTLGDGNNSVTGSAMSEWIWTGLGSNTINTGSGYDEVYVHFNNSTSSTLTVTGSGGTVLTSIDGVTNSIANAELVGLYGTTDNAATTTMDASALTGFTGQVVFWDNNGSNIDIGSAGSDIFSNVTGATLGHDVYTGNGGADVFDYTYAVDAMTGDTITDFDSNDTIDLRFNNLEVGGSPLLANQFIGSAAFTGVAGQYRYYVSGGQTFLEVDTDGDGVGDHSLNIANGTYQLVETEAGSNILKMGAPATSGTDGNDILTGTAGDDVIHGLAGDDTISGLGGNDLLYGGDGIDGLYGDAGDDVLDGGRGNDGLFGGAGNDRIVYDPEDNPAYVNGGDGNDVLVVRNFPTPTHLDLNAMSFEAAEITLDDTAGNTWSSVTTTYNAEWTMVERNILNDDSSRVVVQYDALGTSPVDQVWISYDAAGRLASVDQLFDNGARTFIDHDEANVQPWSQAWFTYAVDGSLDSQDLLFDNGTRTFINYDQDNSQNWSQDWFTYDQSNQLDSQDVLFDDGTRTFINYDQDNTKSWGEDWFTYDTQGRLDSQDLVNDDGTRTFINYDQDNSQSWSQAWFSYDAQARLDTQDIINDDNSGIFYDYDQAGTEAFQWTAYLYDSSHTVYQQVVHWDDGTTSYYTL